MSYALISLADTTDTGGRNRGAGGCGNIAGGAGKSCCTKGRSKGSKGSRSGGGGGGGGGETIVVDCWPGITTPMHTLLIRRGSSRYLLKKAVLVVMSAILSLNFVVTWRYKKSSDLKNLPLNEHLYRSGRTFTVTPRTNAAVASSTLTFPMATTSSSGTSVATGAPVPCEFRRFRISFRHGALCAFSSEVSGSSKRKKIGEQRSLSSCSRRYSRAV